MSLSTKIKNCLNPSAHSSLQPTKEKNEAVLNGRKIKALCQEAAQQTKANSLVSHVLVELVTEKDHPQLKRDIHILSEHFSTSSGMKTLKSLKEKLPVQTGKIDLILDEAALKLKLKQLKLDPSLAEIYPEDLAFLFKTRLIYSIIGYQNNTAMGPENHKIEKMTDKEGKPYLAIKKEGQWVAVSKIKKEMNWDSKEGMLATKNNPHQRWNYFKDGLAPLDRYYHHEAAQQSNYPQENALLSPVEQLSPEEMSHLLEHAKKFTGFNTEKNPNNEDLPQNCVVQLVTHPRAYFKSEIGKNFNGQFPIHCGIRIITSDGSVYSTGFGSTLHEDGWNFGYSNYLASINGQPTMMDYEEYRQHDGRIITTLPINEMRAEYMLAHLNAYRSQTIRFNILKQNCMRLGTNMLGMSGVHLDINVPLEEVLFRALPDLKQIPVVGKPLGAAASCFKRCWRWIKSKTPQFIQDIFATLKKIILYVPGKVGALLKNLVVLSFGGKVHSPNHNQAQLQYTKEFEDKELQNYNMLFSHLFDSNTSDIQHSSPLVNWQLQQSSTFIHKYSGQPCMNLMPLNADEDLAFHNRKLKEFQDLYKYSEPKPSQSKDTKISNLSFKRVMQYLAPWNVYKRVFKIAAEATSQ